VCHNQSTVDTPPRRHLLDHRVPPLLVAFAVALCMRAALFVAPQLHFGWTGRAFVGMALAISGGIVAAAGVVTFRRHQTTVNPFHPATASTLVETGIYRRTRNPMYVGVTLILLGYAAFLAHPMALLLVALFPAYIHIFQIAPEERALDGLFGEAYARYKERVPRWL
jgi:protein-S-isoprenylcysteine O-methyltransferase Ste14